MIRIPLAVIAGYAVMSALVIVGDVVFERSADLSFVNLLFAFPYGFIGGWLAARVAADHEIDAGLFTGLMAIAMSILSYELNPGRQPIWYWVVLTSSLAAGSVYGAFRKLLSVRRSAPRKKKK